MPIFTTLQPVDLIPSDNQSYISGLEFLPSLPMINEVSPRVKAKLPRLLPNSVTICSDKSS